MYSVLITDASEGIGLEMAREFLFEPNPPEHMFATYQQGESTRDLELLQQIFPQLKIFQLSVNTDTHVEENLRELREYVESYVGDAGLNILINNSKFYEYRLETLFLNTTSTSIDTRQRYFPTNATPPLQLIKEFYPLLKKAASQSNSLAVRVPSVIVNVTSLLRIQSHLSRVSSRASNFYKVSKSALNFISQSTANQLPSQRILVVEIHPGTEIHSGLRDFHSIVLETRDIVKDLTGNGGNLLRSLEEDQHSQDKLFIPLGVSLLLKPIQLRAML